MHATTIPNAARAAKPAAPWYTQRWPWLLMLGPVLVILAGSYTMWLAYSRQDALVVDDYYKQGKAINQDLRRDRTAARLGMTAALQYAPANGNLSGAVASLKGAQQGVVQLHLIHATQPEKDLHFQMDLNAQGRFSVALPMLEKTRWQVVLEDQRRAWRLEGIWQWPQQSKLDLRAERPSAGE